MSVPAPLEELPLLVRAGSVLALLPESVDTLAPYGSGDVVRLDETQRRLHLLAFPRARSASSFGESGRLASRSRRGRWTLSIRGARRHRILLEASLTTSAKRLRPCAVLVGRKRLKPKTWSARRGVLRARFRTGKRARTRVTVLDRSRCAARTGRGEGAGGGRR